MRRLSPGRVSVVCAEVPPEVVGGLGRYAERMMPALRAPVTVYGTTAGRTRTERIGGVTLHRLRTPGGTTRLGRVTGMLAFNVRAAWHILRTSRSGSVVAVHDWMGCLAGILCAAVGRRPVVFHVHTQEGGALSLVGAGIAALERAQARLARLVVVPSAGMRDDLTARGWPAARLRVIPHGFEDPELVRLAEAPAEERERLRDEVRARYLPGGAGRLIVFAGRLSSHKGVRELIRAVPILLGKHDHVRVVLVGAQAPRTDDNAAIARLIDELGVGAHVVADYRFLPPADVFAHFLAADVCAFPSTYEPFGLVAVEAMALGRPVVVGPGYSAEVVGDGALRCADDLSAALLQILDDPVAAGRLGRSGAAHVRDRYSWARTAELTLAAYAEAAR
ncbi:glycosyltransferase family 4 protein [Streptosporangiaceae bacterium NEAU-GS5]|nr:glycosyltransferase family 4 protein [Streptosporangiaceae bacterium NEAU-GS5]